MALMDQISKDIVTAMRAKDQARLAPLRMAKAALMNREVEKGRPLDEAEAQQVIVSLIKQRRDSVEQFVKGGRASSRRKKLRRSRRWKPTCRRRWIRPISSAPSTRPSRRAARPRRRTWAV